MNKRQIDIQRASVNTRYLAINMLDYAKANIRVEHDRDDTVIEGFIRRAIDKIERETGLTIFESRYEIDIADHVSAYHLYRHDHKHNRHLFTLPIRPIRRIEITDSDGNDITPLFVMRGDTTQLGIGEKILEIHGNHQHDIHISVGAGYDNPDELPPQLEGIILRLVGHYYENRESILVGVNYSTYSDFETDVSQLWIGRV